jgi:serine/threonine protein kinase
MNADRFEQISRLFQEALQQPALTRGEFLARACGADAELRAEVERMVVAHEAAGSFLDSPPQAPDSLMQSPTAALVGRRISHYQVLSRIGAGGMGEVFLAEDTTLGRRVAVKLLPPEFTTDRDRLRRFEQEAKTASALNHPNIVTIHEIGRAETEIGTFHYIAEEFIEGRTLRDRIALGQLPIGVALDIAEQTAGALHVAHAAGIVHRDIKPENLMLRPDGYIKVLDFGLAKLTEPLSLSETDSEAPTMAKTVPGAILGTTAYMSPEQTRGLEIDARSDIWSLGVVLHELLAGERPFRGPTPTDIIVSIVDREPPRLPVHGPHAPELQRIVSKTLAKQPDDRYQTAKDLAIDLKNLRRRMELDAELARISQPFPDRDVTPIEQLPTVEHLPQHTAVIGAAAPTPARSRAPLLTALAVAIAAIVTVFVWLWQRPAPPAPASAPPLPERQLAYTLMLQRMRDGKPFRDSFAAAGQILVEDGWKFRLQLSAPQSGYVYLLNEGPTDRGAIGYQYLFPFPSVNNGSAQLPANQSLQTVWYVVSKNQGTERLLLIWSREALAELEAIKGVVNETDKGLIREPDQLDAVRNFLGKYAQTKPEAETDRTSRQTTLRGRGEVFVHTIELEHR